VSRKLNFAILACAAAFALATVAQAASPVAPAPAQQPDLELIERPGTRFDRSLEAAALRVRYDILVEQARRFDVEPETNALARRSTSESELRSGIRSLDQRLDAARKAQQAEQEFAPSGGTIAGVSLATLNAIAACESGGDPTAVNPAGYYGKYQFDTGTWASVGGTGNPAEASEAEQDYRAALLYSRAGASPWPVCGA
jgi:soluble lytic murein transglycosylase-like protein